MRLKYGESIESFSLARLRAGVENDRANNRQDRIVERQARDQTQIQEHEKQVAIRTPTIDEKKARHKHDQRPEKQPVPTTPLPEQRN